MPLEAPVMTATFPAINAVSLSDSGLARLAHLRLRRDRGPDRDHGGSPARSPDSDGPADHARHARHPRPGPGPGTGDPDPLRQRPVLRALLCLRFRPHRALRLAIGGALRTGPRAAGSDPDHSGPAFHPSADGIRADRLRARAPRAARSLRPELRAPDGRGHAAGSRGLRRDPGGLPEALAASIERAAATSVE